MAKTFNVSCTMIYNGSCTIDAENEKDAINKVAEMLNYDNLEHIPEFTNVGDVCFAFGEATADYADEVE